MRRWDSACLYVPYMEQYRQAETNRSNSARSPIAMDAKQKTARPRWRRALLATTARLRLGAQNAAWAVCADGSAFPPGGYQIGIAPAAVEGNWTPNLFIFSDPEGSLFIPDS